MSQGPASGLYIGTVRHRRLEDTGHGFTYPLFMAFLDVSRLDALMTVSPFTGYNRWNWASFHESDHFGDPARPLRERLAADAARHGHRLPDGRVFVLTHLRYLGYCFNPVTFFYCYDAENVLRLVLAEVNNTVGETWNYWLVPARRRSTSLVWQASADKAFYVSPFMPPALRYRFTFTDPGDRLVVRIAAEPSDAAGARFDATLSLRYRPWTPDDIRRTLIRHPFMTARVIGAIYWQALKLWSKGTPSFSRVQEGT